MARAVVMGLGITGRAVVDALAQRNFDVVAFDDRPTDQIRTWANRAGVDVQDPDRHRVRAALAGADFAIPAPGLPEHHPFFDHASDAAVDIVSEFDLATMWDDRPAVAVTGTDGKTTVVTLIHRMLEASGVASEAVGNTDTPWVAAIDDPEADVFVVEASSFRLGHSRAFSPAVAIWLNFGADHLDAHSGLDSYEAAKASIWSQLDSDALALANRDDPVVERHAKLVQCGEVETWGLDDTGQHGFDGQELCVAGSPLVSIRDLPRSLPHDISNGLAASVAAMRVGGLREACASTLRDFTGLPHRLESILESDGVRWVNDSKATTPHAAAAGLVGFDSVVLLAGGRNKGLAFDDLVAHHHKLRHVIALGESADLVASVFEGLAPVTKAVSMQHAVSVASDIAIAGDVVLLAPACASFDWYDSYRARGEDFERIVRRQHGSGVQR